MEAYVHMYSLSNQEASCPYATVSKQTGSRQSSTSHALHSGRLCKISARRQQKTKQNRKPS
eukprot:1157697-Pelagomonas_calceolata.AAC.8